MTQMSKDCSPKFHYYQKLGGMIILSHCQIFMFHFVYILFYDGRRADSTNLQYLQVYKTQNLQVRYFLLNLSTSYKSFPQKHQFEKNEFFSLLG
jgi:hypothetical protein